MSLTVVRYRRRYIPFALLAMAVFRLPLMLQKSCSFWKLMGSGRNGTFDIHPDWQQWALLSVWNDYQSYEKFNRLSFISSWWSFFKCERWDLLCVPLQSHGKWDKKEPFGTARSDNHMGMVGVLTRATIRLNRLKAFWSHVGDVAQLMSRSKGYITSVGIGEAPFFKQATFSIWENIEDVKAFAYKSREHAEVIKKTRNEKWYSEELFARFKIISSTGSVNGVNPLKIKLIK
jgi:heme-degrading monooxygenase HmoA